MASDQDDTPLIRVAVVEDDPRLREHFVESIASAPQLDLVWSASSIEEARDCITKTSVDVALIDLGLPDGDGSDLIGLLQDQHGSKVLIVTIFDDRKSVVRCMQSGADGYIVKESSISEIVESIKILSDGGSPISATAARHLISLVRDAAPQQSREDVLTPRERELLQLFAKGLTYRETAENLGISRHTVGDHMKSIYRKLAVNSRSEAVYEALQHKMIEL